MIELTILIETDSDAKLKNAFLKKEVLSKRQLLSKIPEGNIYITYLYVDKNPGWGLLNRKKKVK